MTTVSYARSVSKDHKARLKRFAADACAERRGALIKEFDAMYHLGDPCIHCGQPHDDVEPGICAKAIGLGARVRNVEYLTELIASHEELAAKETARWRSLLAAEKTAILRVGNGLDLEKIKLAESFMYASDPSRGGQEWKGARDDAVKWFATGKAGYRGLKYEYFGTKNYDRWSGQRCDCEYGMGPSLGVPNPDDKQLSDRIAKATGD